MNAVDADLQAELEDRLRFETVLAELSARFVNLPPERVDEEIEEALRRLVAALRVDRTALGRLTEDGGDFVVTHSFALPGIEAFPLIPSLATVAPLDVPDAVERPALRDGPFRRPARGWAKWIGNSLRAARSGRAWWCPS
jgi:hypothetical protein